MSTITELCEALLAAQPEAFEPDGEVWIINVAGYGAFAFIGNEADCERLRAGKAAWEGSIGTKWRALECSSRDLERTGDALDDAIKHRSAATWRNYGRAEPTP